MLRRPEHRPTFEQVEGQTLLHHIFVRVQN
jgi:hypothetical protein